MFFFLPEKKKIEPEKIFNILPEKFSNWPRKNLENCPRRKNCAREKNSKIPPEKKKILPEKKMEICARDNSKSTREKIRSKISTMNFFLMLFLGLWRAYVMLIFLNLFNAFVKAVLSLFAKFFVRLRRASVIVKLATWS